MNWVAYVLLGVTVLSFSAFYVLQRIKNRGPNDGVSILHIATVLMTAIVAFFAALATAGCAWSEPLFLDMNVGLYLFIDGLYSFAGTLSDRHAIRAILRLKHNEDDPLSKVGKRYGQYIGTGFVSYCILLIVLAAAKAPAPFCSGNFMQAPESVYVAMGVTVGIIGVASIAKSVIKNVPRTMQNSVLFFLSVYSTLAFAALIMIELFGGTPVVPDYKWFYFSVILTYVLHDLFMWYKFKDDPGFMQHKKRYPGHVVALSVVIFYVYVVVLYHAGIGTVFPSAAVSFILMTMLLLGLGTSVPRVFEEVKEFIKKRKDHKYHDHPHDIKDCKEDDCGEE